MTLMAQYVLEAECSDSDGARQRADQASNQIAAWLRNKGHKSEPEFILEGNRQAQLSCNHYETDYGVMDTWSVLEEVQGGFLETRIQLAFQDTHIRLWCTVSAGGAGGRIAPMEIEVFCPTVIRTIIKAGRWSLAGTPLSDRELSARGTTGGQELLAALLDPTRSLPIVVISKHFGMLLHPDIATRLAKAVTGLALVVVADEEACWQVTSKVGKPLSCFHGGIRIYWPGFASSASPRKHPLWTSSRILQRASSIEAAVAFACNEFRRLLNAVSTVALSEPSMMGNIRRASATTAEIALRKEMEDRQDYKGLADSYAEENTALKGDVAAQSEQLAQLRAQLYRMQTESAWADASGEMTLEEQVEPESVKEALERARVMYAANVRFGEQVEDGVRELAPDAGPPAKILKYLEGLNELAVARRARALGTGMVAWLGERNISASNESETIKKSASEMAKRTWHDGHQPRSFELHLKPNDGVAPDKCVRIYFDWDDVAEQIVVGWVGRHP